jgi:hypothetical protein
MNRPRPRPRPLSRLLLVLAAVTVSVLGLVGPATAAAPYCGITWGSTPKTDAGTSDPGVTVTAVRAGQHACYDRLVIDLHGRPIGGYDVRYVPGVGMDGSGTSVPVLGGAALQVVAHAPAYDAAGPTLRMADERNVVPVTGFRTLRQVAWAGSFEGYTTFAVGTRARLPFRVFVLPDAAGDRMVVDVAHLW